jgi:hypothetical protein
VRGIPREIHFGGVDFGIVKDGTAINLTRVRDGKIELAYHEVWYPKKKWKESNPHLEAPLVDYALTLEHRNRLDIDEIANWFFALSKRFYIHKGVFDQWAGPVFEQILHKRGLHQFEMRNFFNSDSSNMYQILHLYMLNRQLRVYDWPVSGLDEKGKPALHSPLITEMLELQASSAGKNIVVVEAPKISGKHDDSSDAFARSVLLASEYLKDNPSALRSGSVYDSMAHTRPAVHNYHQFQRMRARMGHATPRERSVPAAMRRR